jgi:hypothetical protein
MAGDGDHWLEHKGYRVLDYTEDAAVLGAGDPMSLYLVLEREEGAWVTGQWGTCRGLRSYREGLVQAEWELDPDFPTPTATDATVRVLAKDLQCASGQPPDERLLEPEVEIDESVIVITFWAEPLVGGATCPGHPAVKRTVDLDEPRGERALADGGEYPPREILSGWR